MSSANSLSGKQSISNQSTMSKSKSETVNYLLLYEAMVRHQDLEFDATHEHIALTIGRIQHLGRKSVTNKNNENAAEEDAPKGMLTYLQMRRCLLRLGYTWNRSLLAGNPSSGVSRMSVASSTGGEGPQYYHDYDDDVSVMSTGSAGSFISGGGVSSSSATSGGMGSTRDIIATDAQLIMLLTTLVEMEERHRAAKLAEKEDDEEEEKEEADVYSKGLFLPEFIQAYKLIIGGMQSLQTYPDGNDPMLNDLRVRSRERTLGLLRLFGSDSKLYKEDPYAILSLQQQSAGEDPTSAKGGKGKKSTRDGLRPASNRSSKKNRFSSKIRGAQKAKDGLLPRLNEEEIRTMVHSKDQALAKILEEHETEMNVMANNMEELRRRTLQTQKNMKKRRRRTKIAAFVAFVLLVCGGGFYELRKREQVKEEILTGREAERKADAAKIAALKDEVSSLKSKLNDAEATIRYEEGRYAKVTDKFEKASKTLEESEKRWVSEQKELERCRVTRKELDEELTTVSTKNDEMVEEVEWCRERLAGAERAMEGMEQALKKSRKSGEEKKKVPSFAEITKEMEKEKGLVATAQGNDKVEDEEAEKKKGGKHKPVQMEMKYNKSFRNAVIMRQVYSAVAGMVVSALFPAAKLIRLFVK